jgi:hypothetical protein
MDIERIEGWRGQDVLDRDGEKLGKLEDVYVDLASDEPGLAAVKSGLLARKVRLVPLLDATFAREAVRVTIAKERFDTAPEAGEDGVLERGVELTVFEHFALSAPTGDEGPRYEATRSAAARHAEAEEQRRHADELEAAAQRRADEGQDAHRRAQEAQDAARAAEREREDALNEARSLRERADEADRPPA